MKSFKFQLRLVLIKSRNNITKQGRCTQYTVQCTQCTVQCTLHCTQCTVQCTVHCTQCTVQCNVHCTQCTVQCTQCTVHCTQCTVQCTQCTVLYTVYSTVYTVYKQQGWCQGNSLKLVEMVRVESMYYIHTSKMPLSENCSFWMKSLVEREKGSWAGNSVCSRNGKAKTRCLNIIITLLFVFERWEF